jgi:hypothetical protein
LSDCIDWHKSCTTAGYGNDFKDGHHVYAHRRAWEEVHGPIPGGMQVHHTCGRRKCVNVEHMQIVSRRDHAGAAGHGKLTLELAREIRAASGSQRRIAEQFGVSRSLVGLIRQGLRWRED